MHRQAETAAAQPTLDQALRFADLSFECAAEAHRRLPQSGDEKQVQALFTRLRLEAMEREGLPLSLLGDGKTANQRHFEQMQREHGVPLPWGPAPLSSFADIAAGARHPLQATLGMEIAA